MPEVPEHLLERSRARRAALGLGGDDAGGAAPASGGESTEVATTGGDATPAPIAAATKAPAVVIEAPPPPAYVQAALDRKKIPWWAAASLALLPIWAVVYAGTLSEAGTGEPSVLTLGGEIYAEQCALCHGATGAGGVGPALADGAVLETFPNRADHLFWVWGGSLGWPDSTYGATNKTKKSGMPAFGESLTPEELLAVVRYEREVLSGEEILEENGESIDPEEHLFIVGEDGTAEDALLYYFGEGAEGGTFTVVDDAPFINGAEFSAPAE